MSRQTSRFVISILLLIVTASTVFAAPVPGEQSRTTLRPSTDREILSRFSPESIAAFRQQLMSIFQREYEVIAASGQANAKLMVDSKMKIVANASDADLARLMNAGVDLGPLDASVERVHSWVQKNRELAASARVGKPATDSTGFPDAAYSFCGSTRNAAEGMFAAEVVLEVAKGVWSVASRGCDEVIVILGEGGQAPRGLAAPRHPDVAYSGFVPDPGKTRQVAGAGKAARLGKGEGVGQRIGLRGGGRRRERQADRHRPQTEQDAQCHRRGLKRAGASRKRRPGKMPSCYGGANARSGRRHGSVERRRPRT